MTIRAQSWIFPAFLRLNRATGSLLWVVVLSVLLTACARPRQSEYLRGNTMGTSYTVHYVADASYPTTLQPKIDALLNVIEDQLSNWRPDSWVSQLNAAPAFEEIPVPAHAFAVIQLCLKLAEQSQGAFDPTVSPLVELWGFGTKRGQIVPSTEAIATTRELVGYRRLVLDTTKLTLLKTVSKIELNCSAVAKGYAVDQVAVLLRAEGITDFLINIGGELFAEGNSIYGSPWAVAIRRPDRTPVSEDLFALSGQAMATSGHTERVYFADGRRYSHIIDPRTGFPVEPNVASATIIAPTCALADGLATLALVLNEAEMNAILDTYPATQIIRTPWEN